MQEWSLASRAASVTLRVEEEPQDGDSRRRIAGFRSVDLEAGNAIVANVDVNHNIYVHAAVSCYDPVLIFHERDANRRFALARRKTVADADGRFKFSGLAAGDYYVCTDVIWGAYMGSIPYTTGGLVGQIVHVNGDSTNEVVLSQLTFSKLRAMDGEYTK